MCDSNIFIDESRIFEKKPIGGIGMSRLFQTNELRKVHSLDGSWDFTAIKEEGDSLAAVYYPYKLMVPGCWEKHPDFLTYRGRGAYRKRVSVKEKTALRFVFKGVSHTARVYFDGELIAEHYNAYTAFHALVHDVEQGEHELVVLVDNSFGEHSALHVPNDYYTYGGINRPVVMEVIKDLYVERIAFTPIWEKGAWKASVQAFIHKLNNKELNYRLGFELNGKSYELGEGKTASDGVEMLSGVFDFPDVGAWSPESPVLYELKAKLAVDGEEIDDLIERVGFREVTTLNGKIQLNGKDIVLKGVNRHEDHPMVGSAIPLQLSG
jgi:beta-glucuronidase